MGYRLYEVSVCLEWESVPPGNQRVPESRPCKHGAASARRTRSSGSRFLLPIRHLGEIDSDPPQEISETRVGAEGTEFGTEQIAIKRSRMLLERAVKPAQRFVFLSERYIHRSD